MTHPGRLFINLDALAENWRTLARKAAPAECAAVIKANAYGIGVEHAASALWRAGARSFFVAQLREGRQARAVLGTDARIFVLNGLETTAHVEDYKGLIPVLSSLGEYQRWDKARPFALHVDTGMNRLGLSLEDVEAARLASPVLLMSHLVAAQDPDSPLNDQQIEAFYRVRQHFPHVAASLANSSGIFLPACPHYDLVRPGYALYGGNPTPALPSPVKPVVTLEVVVQQTRWIEAGETAGYDALWTAQRRTRLATLLIGYADGLPVSAGASDRRAGASVWIGGQLCPLVGRISMDLAIADITDAAAEVSAWAEIFGPHNDLDRFAGDCGTIGYELLTRLGGRYERIFVQDIVFK